MTRVLKPGGTLVVATWCERDEGDKPFTPEVSLFDMICTIKCLSILLGEENA